MTKIIIIITSSLKRERKREKINYNFFAIIFFMMMYDDAKEVDGEFLFKHIYYTFFISCIYIYILFVSG
jgi:hypothetical protein